MTNDPLRCPAYQITASPAYRAVWEDRPPLALFRTTDDVPPTSIHRAMEHSLSVVRRHQTAGTLLDAQHRLAEPVLKELGDTGYWGLRVAPQYGGVGSTLRSFFPFLARMATVHSAIAGIGAVHSVLGPVNSIQAFGNSEQQTAWLPRLARGQCLGALGLTEPGAGSDLAAIQTRALPEGDSYSVHGEKVFITNLAPGRVLTLVCRVDNILGTLICELPQDLRADCRLRPYGLWALKHTLNQGLILQNFRVPVQNLLQSSRRNGLAIVYHSLNRGRVALCANAAGTMRRILAGLLPWVRYRTTCGQPLQSRQLIQRRLGRLAALITGCDAIVAWCARLLDDGYRCEMEGILAKVFGSDALKEAALEIAMRSHGGRAFLHGHPIGDEMYDYLAPSIYEGEGELLSLALVRSLMRQSDLPMGDDSSSTGLSALPDCEKLRGYAEFAIEHLRQSRAEVENLRAARGVDLLNEQCRVHTLSMRIQKQLVILCSSLYGADRKQSILQDASAVLCRDLQRELTGQTATDEDWRLACELGQAVLEQGFPGLAEGDAGRIQLPYD